MGLDVTAVADGVFRVGLFRDGRPTDYASPALADHPGVGSPADVAAFADLVEVGAGRHRQIGDAAAMHGIDDRMRLAAFAAAPVSVDEQLELCVIIHALKIGAGPPRANPS